MSVRSEKLFAGPAGGVGTAVIHYTVPAGKTTILKHIVYYNGGPTAFGGFVLIFSGPTQINLLRFDLDSGQSISRDVWVVLAPGDRLGSFQGDSTGAVWFSGTELEGVSA